jgi:hypothetical protein
MGSREVVDITGNKYGKLLVINREGRNKSNKITWKCRCDCGKEVIVTGNNLKNGHTQSCGCLHKEADLRKAKRNNMSETKLGKAWYNMIYRATSPKNREAHRYLNRGITVCDEWRDSFESFVKWSMDNGYADNLSLDRINNNKGYSPDNCRWVNQLTQVRNRENTIYLEYKGEKKTLKEWADILGIKYQTLFNRLRDSKWDVESIIEKPLQNK